MTHTVLLCLYVADPATFLASDSVLGTLYSSENSLFIQLWQKQIFLRLYHHVTKIANITILSLNFIYKPLKLFQYETYKKYNLFI